MGRGCNLDSVRFHYLPAVNLAFIPAATTDGFWGNVAPRVWLCGVNVAGFSLQKLNLEMGADTDGENWKGVAKMVVEGAYEVFTLKGYTNCVTGLVWRISLNPR